MVLEGGADFWACQSPESGKITLHGSIEEELPCKLVACMEDQIAIFDEANRCIHVYSSHLREKFIVRDSVGHLGCHHNGTFSISDAGDVYQLVKVEGDDSFVYAQRKPSFHGFLKQFRLEHHVEQLACGRSHAMVLSDHGLFSLNISRKTLRQVPLEFKPINVYCGGNFTLVQDSSHCLWARGTTSSGKNVLDIPNREDPKTFYKIHPSIQAKQVSCGSNHVVWIELDGALKIWGLWSDGVTELLPHARCVYAGFDAVWALDLNFKVYSGWNGKSASKTFSLDETLDANLFPDVPSRKWTDLPSDLVPASVARMLMASDLPPHWDESKNPPPSLTSWNEYHKQVTEFSISYPNELNH